MSSSDSRRSHHRRGKNTQPANWLRWIGVLWGSAMGGLVTLADGDDRIGGLWLIAGVALSYCGRPLLLGCIGLMEPAAQGLVYWWRGAAWRLEERFRAAAAPPGETRRSDATAFRPVLLWLPGLWSLILGFLAGGLAGVVCYLADPEGLQSGSQAGLLGIAAGLLLTPWIVGLSLAVFLPWLERLARGPKPSRAERVAILFTPLLLPVVAGLGLLQAVWGLWEAGQRR